MTILGRMGSEGEGRKVRFERRFACSPEELWDALTDPARLSRWLGCEAEIDGRVGGGVRFGWSGEQSGEMVGEVLAWEPPRLLEYTWLEGASSSRVRFSLGAEASETVLVLEHRLLPEGTVAGLSAGWHAHLDGLAALSAGEPFDWDVRFGELIPQYQEAAALLV